MRYCLKTVRKRRKRKVDNNEKKVEMTMEELLEQSNTLALKAAASQKLAVETAGDMMTLATTFVVKYGKNTDECEKSHTSLMMIAVAGTAAIAISHALNGNKELFVDYMSRAAKGFGIAVLSMSEEEAVIMDKCSDDLERGVGLDNARSNIN